MDTQEKKDLIQFNLLREDSLNSSRLNWMLTFQGFLFATYFVAELNSYLLPILGVLASIVTVFVSVLGVISVNSLLNLWHEIEDDKSISPFGLQKPGGWVFFSALGLHGMLPIGCLVSWIYIICQ